ncbi:hypothetical protein ACFQPA_18910 [Halomarina halobia]|uniref:Uncharacterized protein n=1 Tax=Halomarina halobia TaxID=3033386 RepID=A0ABD6AD09_9EURY|nr:hypothetical protein [Halomarina sp. PSR21]
MTDRSHADSRRPSERCDPLGSDNAEVEDVPPWWRAAIREHERYDLGPYLPPRFSDGVLLEPEIERLEDEHGVEITIMGVNVRVGDSWTVFLDGEPAFETDRRRTPEGYTLFELSSTRFAEQVRTELDADDRPDSRGQ